MQQLYKKSFTVQSRKITVSSVVLDNGAIETMALDTSTGEEIKSFYSRTEKDAKAAFSKLCKLVKPFPAKYAKLRDDIKEALSVGRRAEDANPEDGGACNFDSTAISLPHWDRVLVVRAIREAGSTSFVWNCYGSKLFVVGPISRAQANARSRNAEAVTKSLAAMGYDVMDYSQLD